MKIRFRQDIEFEVVSDFDSMSDTLGSNTEIFDKDEVVEAEIVSEDSGRSDIQFENGSVALGVLNEYFEVK